MKRRLKAFIKEFTNIVQMPEMKVLPGQLAFYFVLSIIPIVALAGYLIPALGISALDIKTFFDNIIPSDVASFLATSLSEDSISKSNFVLFFISAFILASNGTSSMIITSNSIYKVKGNGFLERRIKSLIMMIILVMLLLFVLLVPAFGDVIMSLLMTIWHSNEVVNIFYKIYKLLQIPLSLFLIFLNIKLLYTMAPDTTIRSKDTTFGALFTSLGWLIATRIYSFYVSNFAHYNLFYGSISSLLILLLWVYILAYIFVVGMAFNAGETSMKLKQINKKNKEEMVQ